MSNYLAHDIRYLWKWVWTYWPWRVTRKMPVMNSIIRKAHWTKIIEDGWFLGWPLWFGKRRGKG